jgi:hypothetical protein
MSAKIVGYQVQDDRGNNWAGRPSYEILTEATAISDLTAARKGQGFWLMIAILEDDIEEPAYESGGPQVRHSVADVATLVAAAKPLAELLFDHHQANSMMNLEVDGGDVTALKLALAPFDLG